MLKVSREVELGLLLMVELAKNSKARVGLKEWSKVKDLPYRFLSKVAVKLKKNKLLKSKEGREGGYALARPASRIRVGEVIKALEGPVKPVRCMQGVRCDCEGFCGHKDLMRSLSQAVEKQLAEVMISDLARHSEDK